MPDLADVQRQILRLEVDKRAAAQSVRDIDKLRDVHVDWTKEVKRSARELGPLEAQMKQYGRAAQLAGRHGDQLDRAVTKTTKGLKSQRRELDANKQAMKAYQQQVRAAREGATLYGDIESRGRALTGAVGYIGGETGMKVERAANIGTEVLASVEAIKLLKLELPELASKLDLSTKNVAAMSAAAIAAGAAVLVAKDALDGLTSGAENARTAVVGAIEGTRDFYDFLADSSSEDARQRIDQINDERRLNELLAQDLRTLQAGIERGLDVSDQGALDAFAEGSLKVLDATGLLNFGLDEIKDALSETNAETVALDTEFRLLVQGILDGSFALNDAKVAAELAAQAERELAQERTAQITSDVQLQIKAANLSGEQAQKRLDQIETEREYYQAAVNDLALLAETNDEYKLGLEKLQGVVEGLNREEAILLQNLDAKLRQEALIANVAELSAKSQEKLVGTMTDVKKEAEDAAKALAEYTEKQAELDAERALSAAREAEDYQRQRVYDLADHYAELADIDKEYYADRGEIITEALADLSEVEKERGEELRELNHDLENMAQDHADNMRKIRRDASRSIEKASAQLDAAAIREAQVRLKDAVEDEEAQYQKEKDEREYNYRERLRLLDEEERETLDARRRDLQALEQKHRDERSINEAAFRQEMQRADQERQIKLQRQAEDYALDDAQRRAHYGIVESDTIAHYNAQLNIHRTGMNAVNNQVAAMYAAISRSQIQTAAASYTAGPQKITFPVSKSLAGSSSLSTYNFTSKQAAPVNANITVNVGDTGSSAAYTGSVVSRAIEDKLRRMILED